MHKYQIFSAHKRTKFQKFPSGKASQANTKLDENTECITWIPRL